MESQCVSKQREVSTVALSGSPVCLYSVFVQILKKCLLHLEDIALNQGAA
jgi:hypothetical protein